MKSKNTLKDTFERLAQEATRAASIEEAINKIEKKKDDSTESKGK